MFSKSFFNVLAIGFVLGNSGIDLSVENAIANDVTSHSKSIKNIQFTIADGLEFDSAMEDALVQWPIAATMDSRGDLLVLECHWNRESVKQQLDSKPHKIVRLSDTNGDRIFDKRTVIATDLGFPEGIMVFGDDLLVTAPPSILRFSDPDGDGVFEKQDVWFDGNTLTHCANDLHGPMMGPDGWIYWTKGAFAEQNHELRGRKSDQEERTQPSKAAHIYRRHPNGGPIERLMTGGMDNPSDITFSPEGDLFFCSTFLHHPGNGLRDGIAHSPRGGRFGKNHQVLDGHWQTGPLLEPIVNLGPAAPASVNYLSSKSILLSLNRDGKIGAGPIESNYLASAQFNLQKIGLHRLIPVGSSFETESLDLVSADRIDFHPVDIIEEVDGSLLVFDTGGWYDLCCPSSGNDQSIAKGGIYRIKPTKLSHGVQDPSRLTLEEAKAQVQNKQLGGSVRAKALWRLAQTITKIPSGSISKETVLSMLRDSDSSVKQAAARIAGLNRWPESKKAVEAMLLDSNASVVRAAIETLGIVGDSASVAKVIENGGRFPHDRIMEHACIYALLEIGNVPSMVRILGSSHTTDHQKYMLLLACQQLATQTETPLPDLVSMLDSPFEPLQTLALDCLAKSPDGIASCIPYLDAAWHSEDLKALDVAKRIIKLGMANEGVVSRFETWLSAGQTQSSVRRNWLASTLVGMSGETLPDGWSKGISAWLDQASASETLEEIANSIRGLEFSEPQREAIAGKMRLLASRHVGEPKVALALMSAAPNSRLTYEDDAASLIIEQLTRSGGAFVSQADRALSRGQISQVAALQLLERIDRVPPLSLMTAIRSLLGCNSDVIDKSLFLTLPSVPSLQTVDSDRLMSELVNRADEVKSSWATMLSDALKPSEDIQTSLDGWIERLPPGDIQKGYEVFRSAKAACSSCHQVGYIGGRLGPELSRIGKSRTKRDLIESIVFPSFRMAQGYYPIRVRTVDGEVFNGLLSKQTDSMLELICGADKICKIDKESIEEQAESKVSVMPMGLEQQMTLAEFADLIAFLESKK